MSNPCLNGGLCTNVNNNGDFQCSCKPGFLGATCDRPDVCGTRPCGTDGTCLPLELGHPISFVCVCQSKKNIFSCFLSINNSVT